MTLFKNNSNETVLKNHDDLIKEMQKKRFSIDNNTSN